MKPNIIPADTDAADSESLSMLTLLAKRLLLDQLRKIRYGRLRLIDGDFEETFGERGTGELGEATIRVKSARFYAEVVFRGTVGAGEAYINGHWHCDNLTLLVRLMLLNHEFIAGVDSRWARLNAPLRKAVHWLNRNHKTGSRRNIAAHYDLGNRFFELFLDESLAYSCGIFTHPDATLSEASIAKFDAALSKLALTPGQHLLEIGTGWGALAIHAARRYGCRVTSTTISREQFELAKDRVAREGLQGQITILMEDYRDLRGTYDGLVSVEMIEAVGHQYLDTYFGKCSALLKPEGAMLLQGITIRDQLYEEARRAVDFIKRFIFPGAFIPSVQAIVDSLARATDMKLFHLEDIGPHYARTLRLWRERFLARRNEVRALGYPESFVRMWEYYLCYCEGGFEERQLGDVQMLLIKPRSRRSPIATINAATT